MHRLNDIQFEKDHSDYVKNVVSAPKPSESLLQNQFEYVSKVSGDLTVLGHNMRAKVSLYVAERRYEHLSEQLEGLEEYWKVHRRWQRRVTKLDAERVRNHKPEKHEDQSSSAYGPNKSSRSGRAHLLGSNGSGNLGTSSLFLSASNTPNLGGSSSLRRPREIYARSEEDVHRLIQQIEDSKEERINRLATDIPDLVFDLQERRERDKKLRQTYSGREVDDILKREFGSATVQEFLGAKLIENPASYFSEKRLQRCWAIEEEEQFIQSYMDHSKDFGKLAQDIGTKTTGQVVAYYYLNKHRLQLKKLHKKHRRMRMIEKNGRSTTSRWSMQETELIKAAILDFGREDIKSISDRVKSKTTEQCKNWLHNHKESINKFLREEEKRRNRRKELASHPSDEKKRKRKREATFATEGEGEANGNRLPRRRKDTLSTLGFQETTGLILSGQSAFSSSPNPTPKSRNTPTEILQQGGSTVQIPSSMDPEAPAPPVTALSSTVDKPKPSHWKPHEREKVKLLFSTHGTDFETIAQQVEGKTVHQIQRFYHKLLRAQKKEIKQGSVPLQSPQRPPRNDEKRGSYSKGRSTSTSSNTNGTFSDLPDKPSSSVGSGLSAATSQQAADSVLHLSSPQGSTVLSSDGPANAKSTSRRRAQSHVVEQGSNTRNLPPLERTYLLQDHVPRQRAVLHPLHQRVRCISSSGVLQSAVGYGRHESDYYIGPDGMPLPRYSLEEALSSSYTSVYHPNSSTGLYPPNVSNPGDISPASGHPPLPYMNMPLSPTSAHHLSQPNSLPAGMGSASVAAASALASLHSRPHTHQHQHALPLANLPLTHPPSHPHTPGNSLPQSNMHAPPTQFAQFSFPYPPYSYYFREYGPTSPYYRPSAPYPSLQRTFQLYPHGTHVHSPSLPTMPSTQTSDGAQNPPAAPQAASSPVGPPSASNIPSPYPGAASHLTPPPISSAISAMPPQGSIGLMSSASLGDGGKYRFCWNYIACFNLPVLLISMHIVQSFDMRL
jgi:hypothetical protein